VPIPSGHPERILRWISMQMHPYPCQTQRLWLTPAVWDVEPAKPAAAIRNHD